MYHDTADAQMLTERLQRAERRADRAEACVWLIRDYAEQWRLEAQEWRREAERQKHRAKQAEAAADVDRVLADAERQGRRSNVAPFPGTGGTAA